MQRLPQSAELETERIVLVPWSEHYLEDYVRLHQDDGVMRYLGRGRGLTRAEALRRFERYVEHWRERGFGPRFLLERESRRFLGLIGLRDTGDAFGCDPGDVEIGWILDPAEEGRGYATEGAAAMLGIAFEEVGLPHVVARLNARHSASARVAERLGMRLWRETEGDWGTMLTYRLERSDWLRQHRGQAP